MISLGDLRAGDLGFGPIGGLVPGVFPVGVGEVLVAPVKHLTNWRRWWTLRHVGTVTQAADERWRPGGGKVGGPLFAQAMPSGFEEIQIGDEHWKPGWIYLRPNYSPPLTGTRSRTGEKILLGVGQADNVAAIARRMVRKKIPYGFEDFAAMAGHRAGIHSHGLDEFIARVDADGDPVRAICSQAVDAQLTQSGGLLNGHVFDDNRLAQDVDPSELYLRLLDIGVAMVFRPGVA